MIVSHEDLESLRAGVPPSNLDLVRAITVNEEAWLKPFAEYYLENFIAGGGSKIKVLVGGEGTGKTHCLRWIESRARELGYTTVSISMRDVEWKFSNLPQLYKTIVVQTDWEDLLSGLSRHVAVELGYGPEKYDGSCSILPLLMEDEGLSKPEATREVRTYCSRVFYGADLTQSFKTFAAFVVRSWMTGEKEGVNLCFKWLSGEKLLFNEMRQCSLYERLTRVSARQWLYSLIRLIRLSGRTGLVLLMDDLEAITERQIDTRKYWYTPNTAKDTFELIRQLIDDAELLEHMLVILSGRMTIVDDDKRGIKSYEALWMRLQTGLVNRHFLNPFADIVSLDDFLASAGEEFAKLVKKRYREVFQEAGLSPSSRDLPELKSNGLLRSAVREISWMTEKRDG
ncbi:MAG: hypothetical protein GHCLOJNM_03529 [bacterium]|nr:hypothetical protein [bacterium]